jgi:hypothetical protein
MGSLPIWAVWSMIPGAAVLTPVLAFLMAVVTAAILGVLREAGVPTVLALAVTGVSGCLLVHRPWTRSRSSGSDGPGLEDGSAASLAKRAAANVIPFPASPSLRAGRRTGTC